MKEAVVLVVIAVVVVGGIGIWFSNGNSIPFLSSPQPVVQPADNQPAAETAKEIQKEKPGKSKLAKSPPKAPPSAPVVEVAPTLIAPVAEVVVAPPKPAAPKLFPAANEIAVGAERENIAEKFGQPALATTTMTDDGRVMETLVYSRKSGRDVTVIRIEDGKVTSAFSR